MKNLFFKDRIFPVLFMVAATLVFVALVSGVSLATQEQVRNNEFLFLRRAILYAAAIPVPENPAGVNELFERRVREVDNGNGRVYYEILTPEDTDTGIGQGVAGYVVLAGGPGLWGEIKAAIGVDAGRNQILGLEFIEQNETPGLGGRISEPGFKEQFRHKTGPFRLVPEGTPAQAGEVNAITGATITSQAVLRIVNKTLTELKTGL